MSKSLKNFFAVKDVMAKHTKEEVRFYFLSAHYRGPQIYSRRPWTRRAASLRRLHNTYHELMAASRQGQRGR